MVFQNLYNSGLELKRASGTERDKKLYSFRGKNGTSKISVTFKACAGKVATTLLKRFTPLRRSTPLRRGQICAGMMERCPQGKTPPS